METITTWKDELKLLHLNHLKKNYPGAFKLSGGYKQKVTPYKDTTANGLTRCIIDWIRFNGGDAQRINSTGTVRKINGRSKYTFSGMRRGTADIHAIIKGHAISIEVKIGRDKMSEAQHREQQRVENAGGLYFVAKDMPGFIKWYQSNFGI